MATVDAGVRPMADQVMMRVNGVKFYQRSLPDGGVEIVDADDTVLITRFAGNSRSEFTYRARYASPAIPGWWRDIYSKRTGRVRIFNYANGAAKWALRMLDKAREDARNGGV